jgi:hypothetical protein
MLPRRLAAPLLLLGVAAAAAGAAPAHASDCVAAYSGSTHVLTVSPCERPIFALSTTAKLMRTPAGAILLDGNPIPGGPTVANTDKVVIHGDASDPDAITIDMSNGAFAPGFTAEQSGDDEIEFEVDGGTGGPNWLTVLGRQTMDHLELSGAGLQLDGDGDVDATLKSIGGPITIEGQGGMDDIDAHAFGDAVTLRGGPDDDVLSGGNGSDDLAGGSGIDRVHAEGASVTARRASADPP